jgi:VanZ family protein
MLRLLLALWLHAPPLAYAALLYHLSSAPLTSTLPAGDKTVHVVAYAGLAGLTVRSLFFGTRWSPGHVFSAASLLAILYGISDEWHQAFVPGRSSGVDDVIADAAGALLGAALGVLVYVTLDRWARAAGSGRFPSRFLRDSRSA